MFAANIDLETTIVLVNTLLDRHRNSFPEERMPVDRHTGTIEYADVFSIPMPRRCCNNPLEVDTALMVAGMLTPPAFII